MKFTIQCQKSAGPLSQFWNSTGFTPAELLFTRDMQQALTYYGSIPHQGLVYVRIHYLLELVKVNQPEAGGASYDWSLLDEGLEWLVRNHLKPFFEIMGNPSSFFNDFNDERQLRAWKDMVTQLALHLMERFGQKEVESWPFESWNEPDGGWWPQWPHDEASFCNYYDACSEGLKAANPRLQLGGPGTCRALSSLFKSFIAHCDCGTNYFTGETGVRLDFISIHEKGAPKTPEDIDPNTIALWHREAQIVEYIREHHPRLAALPFMNNECDPQVGWQQIHTWHARPYYAALACRMIDQHLRGLLDDMQVPYSLLSNDNGFIGTWGNRTLLTRFGQSGWIEDGQSKHQPRFLENLLPTRFPPFELVKKPIFNAWVMLSLLGRERCAVKPSLPVDSPLGVIATRRGESQVAILVYHSRDRIMSSGEEKVSLRLQGLPFQEACLVHYRIDDRHGNPIQAWESKPVQGRVAPDMPSPELYARMRRRQELETLSEPAEIAAPKGECQVDFDLPLHAVSLILLTARPDMVPAKVEGVECQAYEGLTGQSDVLMTWTGLDSYAIQTYEVLCAPAAEGPYERVNQTDLLCSAFLHVFEKPESPLWVKVRAVDYWGRVGPDSDPIQI